MTGLEWKTDTELVVDGTAFSLEPTTMRPRRENDGTGHTFVLRKPRWMVERYERLREQLDPRNVVELGIYQGGSTALFALLLHPKRLVALDLAPARVESLDAFVAGRELQEHVRAYFGVDQADRGRLESIMTEEFGSEPLDLVVDDASHLLRETTASFNTLFPRLRPGGFYVIEDWSWQHASARAQFLMTDDRAREELNRRLAAGDLPNPLSVLVLELVLTAGYAEEIVAEITSVARGWTVIRRGSADLDPDTFDISQCYGALGRTLLRLENKQPA